MGLVSVALLRLAEGVQLKVAFGTPVGLPPKMCVNPKQIEESVPGSRSLCSSTVTKTESKVKQALPGSSIFTINS